MTTWNFILFTFVGKTTLADSLLASNGIFSQKLAGKLRYLDSRKDEQERGITMKSSSISLGYNFNETNYLINLIDSPGHVDFSGEVSAAVRLCDGAVILVDVVEGVCPQTITVLRQAWTENLKPILVLNKIDRLITEQKMTPLDAYIHLQQLLEQINCIVGELFTSKILQKDEENENEATKVRQHRTSETSKTESFTFDWSHPLEDEDDSDLYFCPERENVIFASAIDGWAFTVETFSRIYAIKLEANQKVLQHTLWGDFYLDKKKNRIMRGAQANAKKPLFVQLILQNLWSVYETIVERRDHEMLQKIVSSLKIQVNKRDLCHSDSKIQLKALFGQWLPLHEAVLAKVCQLLPSPLDLTETRVENLMCSRLRKFQSLPQETQKLKEAFLKCSADESACKIICVSKMFTVDASHLPENRPHQLTPQEIQARREFYKLRAAQMAQEGDSSNQLPDIETNVSTQDTTKSQVNEVFIAFARIFSGTVKPGDKVYVLGPKYDPSNAPESVDESVTLKDLPSSEHVTITTVKRIFLLMGRELECVNEASAGSVVGLSDLEHHILKSATLSNSLYCPPFIDLHVAAQPILRVAIEPQNPTDMPHLVQGLKLLNQSDPNVVVKMQETGEHVIITTGEVHLEKCIHDLQNLFAKVPLNVSDPIIPFRETIVEPPKIDMVNGAIEISHKQQKGEEKEIKFFTANKQCSFIVEAIPLPESVTHFILEQSQVARALNSAKGSEVKSEEITKFKERLSKLFREDGTNKWNGNLIECISSFGPKYCGPNVLIDASGKQLLQSVWSAKSESSSDSLTSIYESSLINGFQLATQCGPLCEEPMMGVAFLLKDWSFLDDIPKTGISGPISGQIISTMKEVCRKSFNAQPRRLLMAMYSCTIQVSAEALGE